MKRLVLPIIGLLAALGAVISVARTHPRRQATDPPAPPPASDFSSTVAAVGLVEASTENISVGTPLAGVVAKVFVTAGQQVEAGDALFQLDTRHLRADREVRRQALAVARARVAVAEAQLEDLRKQLAFVEQVEDTRAVSAEEISRRGSAVATAGAALAETRAQAAAAEAQVAAVETELERSTVRAPLGGEILQLKLRVGEFAPASVTTSPLVLLGDSKPLHVRVDVDEHEAWRVRAPRPRRSGTLRGDCLAKTPLGFVRFEPFVVPKRSLTGDSSERVDTRVLQVIYRVESSALPLFVGQQLDVFIDASGARQAQR